MVWPALSLLKKKTHAFPLNLLSDTSFIVTMKQFTQLHSKHSENCSLLFFFFCNSGEKKILSVGYKCFYCIPNIFWYNESICI